MKRYFIITFALSMLSLSFASAQVAEDSELYKTILALDNELFSAYNTCDMETQRRLMDEDLEFYHDSAGLATSKDLVLESIEKNICGKVTRTLVPNSVEVHEIPGYGAVEMGLHKFYNNQEPDAVSQPSRFITIWKKNESNWTITRVISLHKN